ncbi:hypothetical protein, partial [Nostocoides japonicum]|uniref:hypothetical protein n=1 Tax=Nostocoides japonicum TaxID=99481 RepID=UPI00065BA916
MPRAWFACFVLGTASVAFVAGLWTYLAHAPALRHPGLGLDAPGAWHGQDPAAVLEAVRWNYAFVVGYGLALLLATQSARWTFWTPKAGAVARLGRCATWATVAMAVGENLAITAAAHRDVPQASRWAATAAVLATVKWASLVPAVGVAILGALVTLTRLARAFGRGARSTMQTVTRHDTTQTMTSHDTAQNAPHHDLQPTRRRLWLEPDALVVPIPRERPAAESHRGDGSRLLGLPGVRRVRDALLMPCPSVPDPDTGPERPAPLPPGVPAEEQRWARAYNVPSITAEELRDSDREATGFCLSGGGIRSASLALGALESLRSRLLGARYLVSISGGGYTAGALAQLLTAATDPREDAAHQDAAGRARRSGDDEGDRAEGPSERPVRDATHAYTAGTVELDHLRRHSSYIGSTTPQTLLALGVLARGMVATLMLVFLPAVVLGVGAAWYLHAVPVVTLPTFGTAAVPGHGSGRIPLPVWLALATCWATALLLWLAEIGLAGGRHTASTDDAHRSGAARAAATARAAVECAAAERARRGAAFAAHVGLILVVVTVGVFGAARFAVWLGDHVDHGARFGVGTSVGAVLLTYAAGLASIAWRRRGTIRGAVSAVRGATTRRRVAIPQGLLQMLLVALSLAVLAVAWVLLFGVSAVWSATSLLGANGDRKATLLVAGASAGVVALLGGFFDETSLSLHPFYRHRLASAFATRVVARGAGPQAVHLAVPYGPHEVTTLSDYGRVGDDVGPFPEFVFACTANLTGEDRTPPGFTAASFTMGADWIGGPDVGWVRTEALEGLAPRRLCRDLTVQGAVALSAAAIASSMGRMSRWYQVLLALTGARLGAWLPNPAFVTALRAARPNGVVEDWTVPRLPGVRRMTYLLRELFNIHPATERLLHITDGGHYENLGIVEALRRRCTTIYCVDGGGDLPPTARGLAEAIALARSELGVTIELDDALAAEPGTGHLAEATPGLAPLASLLADTPVITGTITYPAASGLPPERRQGRLVVGRALLWSGLPYSLLSYAVGSPAFPHDSTSDQWFSDDQFTAYTELGRHVGSAMARADVAVPVSADASPAATAATSPRPVDAEEPEPPAALA